MQEQPFINIHVFVMQQKQIKLQMMLYAFRNQADKQFQKTGQQLCEKRDDQQTVYTRTGGILKPKSNGTVGSNPGYQTQ